MRTKKDNAFLGDYGERVALQYLRSVGMHIIETNYTLPRQPKSSKRKYSPDSNGTILGEIDIVAQEGDTLVFVEVK